MNSAGKAGLTIAGSELVFHCVIAYERSLANSSLNYAT